MLNRLPFTVSACASKIVALLPPLTGPATASAVPSFSTKLAAVKLPRLRTWLVVVVAPVRLVAPVELPDQRAGDQRAGFVDRAAGGDQAACVPEPPSLTNAEPVMAMLLPVRLIVLVLNRLPFTVSACASRIVALLPPFTGPATASAVPSFSAKLAAEKLPRVATWLVVVVAPVRLVAPVELPDQRAGDQRAGLADRAVGGDQAACVPAPPSLTNAEPVMAMLLPVRLDRAGAEQAAVHRQRLRIEDRGAAAAVHRTGHRQRGAVVQHEARPR